eukprot:4044042-Heterocapsa_arctica.AAC.1
MSKCPDSNRGLVDDVISSLLGGANIRLPSIELVKIQGMLYTISGLTLLQSHGQDKGQVNAPLRHVWSSCSQRQWLAW